MPDITVNLSERDLTDIEIIARAETSRAGYLELLTVEEMVAELLRSHMVLIRDCGNILPVRDRKFNRSGAAVRKNVGILRDEYGMRSTSSSIFAAQKAVLPLVSISMLMRKPPMMIGLITALYGITRLPPTICAPARCSPSKSLRVTIFTPGCARALNLNDPRGSLIW